MSEFLKKGYEIESFMKNVCCKDKARQLHSDSTTRGYCFLRKMMYYHGRCFRFRCILKKLLIDVLIERKGQRYLFHLHVNNYTEITDELVLLVFTSV